MQWLTGDASHGPLRKDRGDELQSPRQRHVLFGIDAEDERPRVVFHGEPVQRRRQRALRGELAFEAGVVEHHEPSLRIDRQARAPEQMVEAGGGRREALVPGAPADTVTVYFPWAEISRLRIDRKLARV